jgi:hypothetical protein
MHNSELYLDLKKTFDTVNHEILLTKLKNIRIKKIALKRIKSYDLSSVPI